MFNSSQARAVLVVPVYNEEARMRPGELLSLAKNIGCDLLFVDDGSTDASLTICRSMIGSECQTTVIANDRNLGKAESIRSGMTEAIALGYTYLGTSDADLSLDAIDLLTGLSILETDMDLLVSSGARVRLAGSGVIRSPLRQWAGRVVATLVSLGIQVPMYDPQSPCKWYRVTPALAHAVSAPNRTRWFGEAELLMRIRPPRGVENSKWLKEFAISNWADVSDGHLRVTSFPGVLRDAFRLMTVAISRHGGSPN